MFVERSAKNPILKPKRIHFWETEAVFNGCPTKKRNIIYLIYRAHSLPRYRLVAKRKLAVSEIGIGQSKDGIEFHDRRRLIISEEQWERFGCENPRVTKFGNKYYIFYTALSAWPPKAEGIKVGLAISRDLKTIKKKHLITSFNAKAMALFPEKIGGKMWAVLTVHPDQPPAKICLASFEKESDLWSKEYWQKWYKNFEEYSLPLQRRHQDHIEVGAPPIKTKDGWLLIYCYIRNYFSENRLFTVEAALLNLKNPFEIIGYTEAPFLTPEEYYEKIGFAPNVISPSGAILKGDLIYLYYGATETTCCLAFINLPVLIKKLSRKRELVKLIRAEENPILTPKKEHPWEAKAVYNPGALYLDGKFHIVYRAMSEDNTSVLGYASSRDGVHIDYRSPEPIYVPREPFEQKLESEANSGCEDPRLTKIGNKIYMFYTAYDGKNLPRVALTWIKVSDFLKRRWNWSKSVPISPPDLDDKNGCLFPEKIKGKYFIIHRSGNNIDSAFTSTLNFDGKTWIGEYNWIFPRAGMWDSKKLGIAAPPIKTKEGWILFYHGISEEDRFYRVGALLLDLKDPTEIIARSDKPLLEPEMPYEKEGQVPNVVFPCGVVLVGNKIFVYYGGADQVVGVATVDVNQLLKALKQWRC